MITDKQQGKRMNSNLRYTKTAIILHWLIGFAIFGMFALGWYMTDLPKNTPERAFYFNLHKSVGITILALVAFRIYWRITHRPPALLDSLSALEKKLATGGHHLLYLLMIAVPVTGIIMSSFTKFGAKWFGFVVVAGVDNHDMHELYEGIHENVGIILLVIIAVHVLGAIKHKFIDKDKTMQRMSLH